MDTIFKCFACEKKFKDVKVTIDHLKFVHFIKDNTTEMRCVIDGNSCSDTFYRFDLLKKHLKICLSNQKENDVNIHSLKTVSSELAGVDDISYLFREKLVVDHEIAPDHTNYFFCGDIPIETDSQYSMPTITNIFQIHSETNPSAFNELDMDNFLTEFSHQICAMKMTHEHTSNVFKLCTQFVENIQKFNEHLIKEENGLDVMKALELSSKLINAKLSDFSTTYKRDKQYISNPIYVAPVELGLGVRFNMTTASYSNVAVPRMIQCKSHYMPITSTIISLFRRKDFREAYIKYNESNEQMDGIYKNYSSGNNFKSSELFSIYPNSLQIVLATDDFDVCNAVGSKNTLHKLCPVYLSIRNIPPQFSSKLDAISLVSLCYSDDLNTKYTDFNDIWRLIVSHISNIERGIDIGGEVIRGTLIYVTSDNLGINTAFQLVKNFSKTDYSCLFCTCSRTELQTIYNEDPSKLRTIEHYNKQIEMINDSTKVNFKETLPDFAC